MERNIYLWRKRLSLAEESRFDFWIDVPALIAKRMQQLAEFDSSNPLLNPHWGDSECSSSAAQPEQNYLAALFDYLWLISKELYQLSLLMEAFEELFDLKPVRPVVVLPSTSRLTGQ